MSTYRHDCPRARLSEGDLYLRMVAFGLGRARLLRTVAVRRAALLLLRHGVTALRRCGAAVWTWQNRYDSRRHMEGLDARLLDDVGLTREDITSVAGKPFWKI